MKWLDKFQDGGKKKGPQQLPNTYEDSLQLYKKGEIDRKEFNKRILYFKNKYPNIKLEIETRDPRVTSGMKKTGNTTGRDIIGDPRKNDKIAPISTSYITNNGSYVGSNSVIVNTNDGKKTEIPKKDMQALETLYQYTKPKGTKTTSKSNDPVYRKETPQVGQLPKLNPVGIDNSNKINTTLPTINPQFRTPKYYDVEDVVHGPTGDSQSNYKWIPANGEPLQELAPEPYNHRKMVPHYQKGGSMHKDMYGNELPKITSINEDRTYYDDRTDRIMLGNDSRTWADKNKVIAHENYHKIQHNEGRDNYDIGHNTDDSLWAQMQKRPQLPSTDDVWYNFYDRKDRETDYDIESFRNRHPTANFIPDDIIVNKYVDDLQYHIPYSEEGEAQYYENTGKEFNKINNLKSGGVIKDNMGQWAHPGEITEIGSDQITMKGVSYPVLGVSKQTGEKKLMHPEKNYKFANTKQVTEYPLMNWLDQYT